MSENFSERYALVATIDPAKMSTSGGTGSTTSAWTDAIDMDVFNEVVFILSVNTIAASSGVSFVVYSDAASATGGMTASITSITQLTNADDDKQVIVVVDSEKLASRDGRDRYVRGKLTVAPTTSTKGTATVACVALAGKPRWHSAAQFDLSTVDEIVVA